MRALARVDVARARRRRGCRRPCSRGELVGCRDLLGEARPSRSAAPGDASARRSAARARRSWPQPQSSSRSRPSSGHPSRSGTQVDGITSARSATASKLRRATSRSTSASASACASGRSAASALGVSGRPMTSRWRRCASPSLISVVPRPPSLMNALSPTPWPEQNVSGSPRTCRASAYRGTAKTSWRSSQHDRAQVAQRPVVLVRLGQRLVG